MSELRQARHPGRARRIMQFAARQIRQHTSIFATAAFEISFSSSCSEVRCGRCATARAMASAPRPRIWLPQRSSSRSPDRLYSTQPQCLTLEACAIQMKSKACAIRTEL